MDSPFQFYLGMLKQRPESCCGTGPTSGKSWLRRFPENSHLKRHWVCSQLSVGGKLLQQFSWSSWIRFFYSCNYPLVATAERSIFGKTSTICDIFQGTGLREPPSFGVCHCLCNLWQGPGAACTSLQQGVHHSNSNIQIWNDKSAICKVIRIFWNMFHPSTKSGFYYKFLRVSSGFHIFSNP